MTTAATNPSGGVGTGSATFTVASVSTALQSPTLISSAQTVTAPGQTSQLIAIGYYGGNPANTVIVTSWSDATWSAGDTSIATVNHSGLVTVAAADTVTIAAIYTYPNNRGSMSEKYPRQADQVKCFLLTSPFIEPATTRSRVFSGLGRPRQIPEPSPDPPAGAVMFYERFFNTLPIRKHRYQSKLQEFSWIWGIFSRSVMRRSSRHLSPRMVQPALLAHSRRRNHIQSAYGMC